ncbi:MAG: ATP-binding protein [Candidatus Zixiibacteriota bacterium]|nr:MAG: ATP-binding protein [candidate division Zixibacteria bacterium]
MPLRIVITGAPASGKSELIERLKEEPSLGEFVFLEEIARQLLKEDPSYRGRWGEFHDEIYRRQVARENSLTGRSFIADRGTADAFAFHHRTAEHYGTTARDEYGRYDAVIHLGSAASLGEKYYRRDAERSESVEEVMKLERALSEVWRDHPGYRFIAASSNLEEKYRTLIETLTAIIREAG